jgi:hypothetical protein
MIIKSFNKGDIDTDQLPDEQAQLAETLENFKKFILEHNGELFVWAKMPGFKQAWVSIDLKEIPSVLSVVEALNGGISYGTEGKVGVALYEKGDNEGLTGQEPM